MAAPNAANTSASMPMFQSASGSRTDVTLTRTSHLGDLSASHRHPGAHDSLSIQQERIAGRERTHHTSNPSRPDPSTEPAGLDSVGPSGTKVTGICRMHH